MALYTPNEKILKCIEEKDLSSLREYIGTIIYTDRAFLHGEFEAAIKYITEECYLVELFEPFNYSPPLKSKITNSAFSKKDFTEAVYELKANFCRERIEDVKIIGRAVYGDLQKQVEASEKEKNQPQKSGFTKLLDKFIK